MSTTQDETQTLQPPEPPPIPDGKSELPVNPTDYPAVPSGGSGDSGSTTTK
jgi:hypothetical protein